AHPFMMVPDLGNTFGHATKFNRNAPSSVNFQNWAEEPIWRTNPKGGGCVGNLPGSIGGTLDNPRISEEGRRVLADLLVQLSDAQLRDLFETARFTRRESGHSVDDWVSVLRQKRDAVVNMRCST